MNLNNISKNAIFVLDFLHSLDYEAYLVGGCVRDLLMDKEIHDYDITTNCPADLILTYAKEHDLIAIPTGLKHGTVTILINKELIEVTTYRIEGDYIDHRRPASVSFTTSLYEDLKRRDFTMNALCLDNNEIIDYFHGQKDIQEHIIRTIGNSEARFEEDALRILRALRFSFTLHFDIEKETGVGIRKSAYLLQMISKERIRDEFIKMLQSSQENLLVTLRDYDVLTYIIPEFELIYDVVQESPYHIYDVFHHTDIALNASIGYPLDLRLAIALHDIEKKNYKTYDEDGIAHFKGHAHASAESARHILNALRFPKDTIHHVSTLIYYHDYYVAPTLKSMRNFLYKLHGNYSLAFEILLVQKFDNQAKAPTVMSEKNEIIDQAIGILQDMEQREEVFSIPYLKVNGKDMITLGYKDKDIGTVLERLVQHIVHHQDENSKERLLKLAGGMKNEIINYE